MNRKELFMKKRKIAKFIGMPYYHDYKKCLEERVKYLTENDIILLHDASESSVKAAFAIIDELGKEGYTFVTVEEILME